MTDDRKQMTEDKEQMTDLRRWEVEKVGAASSRDNDASFACRIKSIVPLEAGLVILQLAEQRMPLKT